MADQSGSPTTSSKSSDKLNQKKKSFKENPIVPKDKSNRVLELQVQPHFHPLPRSSRDCRHLTGDQHPEYDSEGRRIGVITYENTYRMAPDPNEKFRSHVARGVMHTLLTKHLVGRPYDKFQSASMAKALADSIKEKMKLHTKFSKRYKYVCLVTIGERSATPRTHGVAVSSMCLWNADTDNFATASFKSKNVFAVSTVFALYYE